MKNKFLIFIFLFYFYILIFSQSVFGEGTISLSPPTTKIQFTPNYTRTIEYRASSTLDEKINLDISVSGDLIEYLICLDKNISIEPNEMKKFYCTLSLPEKLEWGVYESRIKIMKNQEDQKSMFNIILGLESILILDVPESYSGVKELKQKENLLDKFKILFQENKKLFFIATGLLLFLSMAFWIFVLIKKNKKPIYKKGK